MPPKKEKIIRILSKSQRGVTPCVVLDTSTWQPMVSGQHHFPPMHLCNRIKRPLLQMFNDQSRSAAKPRKA
jgi:hypothetical protein